ncbi:MAG: hypothetical protein JSV43_02930 [Methanobacteriota archaeon]|nr:MAG: hypothetical protein JSV43_02930 [Euryarchaeota archaeon]
MAEKKGMDVQQLHEVVLEIMETQKTMEKELKYLRDNLKAQNTLSKEMLRVHKINRDISKKNTKQLEQISKDLKKYGQKAKSK